MYMIFAFNALAADISIVVLDQKSTPVANSYIELYTPSLPPPTPQEAVIDQVDKEFVPLYSAVPIGSTVSFPNSDNIQHQIYSFSKIKPFDLPLYEGSHTEKITFTKAGILQMGCNIHDWMLSFLYIYESPLFAQSNQQGLVTFTDLPIGEYELRIWSPLLKNNRKIVIQTIHVTQNQTFTQTIKVRKKIRRKPRLENTSYE